jgi:hypothetical protein
LLSLAVKTGAASTLHNVVESGLVISTYCESCVTAGRQLEPFELAECVGWEPTKESIEKAALRALRRARRETGYSGFVQIQFYNTVFARCTAS